MHRHLGLALGIAAISGTSACNEVDWASNLPRAACRVAGASRETPQGQLLTKAQRLIDAANDFRHQGWAVTRKLHRVCEAMAKALDVELPDNPPEGQLEVEVSCGMVSAAVDGVVASALAGPSQLLVSIPPPKCYVEAEAVQECVEKCDLQFVPMDTVQCGLGEAMGGCAGACVGLCHFRNPVACPGAECRGTCKGTCAGVCDGTCSEQCPNQHPKCLDQCSGICEGRCVGECTGTCSGTCVSINMTTCSGACEGTCSTELIEPSCAGQASIHADADCKAACEASVRARSAVCTEPNASVTLVGKTLMGPAPSPTPNQNPNPSAMGGSPDPMTGPTGEEMLAKLMGTLHRNWPAFVATQLNLREVQHVGTAYLNSAMAASAGFQGFPDAQQCLSEALTDMDDTLIVIGITLTVSNQLQASVQAAAAP